MIYIQVFFVQPALHHDPANSALQSPKQEKDDHWFYHRTVYLLFNKKVDKWHSKHNTHEPCPIAVQPFPEVNSFKVRQGKMTVDIFRLSDFFIVIKGCV